MTKTAPLYTKLHHNSDLPREIGIYALCSDDGTLLKVLSKKKVLSKEEGFGQSIRWIISLHFFGRDHGIVYKIWKNKIDSFNPTRFAKSKVCFLASIAEAYPEDLELFLWHPNLLDLDEK